MPTWAGPSSARTARSRLTRFADCCPAVPNAEPLQIQLRKRGGGRRGPVWRIMVGDDLGRDQDGKRVYSCHDCHHISMARVCDSCGSANTSMGSATLTVTSRSSAMSRPLLRELDEVTADSRFSVRIREGFELLRDDEIIREN